MKKSVSPKLSGVVLWSRARLCRNLAGHRFITIPEVDKKSEAAFSGAAALQAYADNAKKYCAVFRKIEDAVCDIAAIRRLRLKPLTDVPNWKMIEYFERGVITENLRNSQNNEYSGILTGVGTAVHGFVNECHHLVLQDIRQGFQLNKAWREVDALDDLFSARLKFAWSKSFGYLLPDSECCGTGLQLTVKVHLPALAHLDELKQISNACLAAGLVMEADMPKEPLLEGFGQMLSISNNMSVTESEDSVLKKLHRMVSDLTAQEVQARERALNDPVSRRGLYNKISCSLAMLRSAFIMTRPELFEYVSWLRLGVQAGLVKGITVARLDRLHREMWASNFLGHFRGTAADALEYVSYTRANALRERLSGVKLTFR